jgi:peptidoglycan hydrolase-like amidase
MSVYHCSDEDTLQVLLSMTQDFLDIDWLCFPTIHYNWLWSNINIEINHIFYNVVPNESRWQKRQVDISVYHCVQMKTFLQVLLSMTQDFLDIDWLCFPTLHYNWLWSHINIEINHIFHNVVPNETRRLKQTSRHVCLSLCSDADTSQVLVFMTQDFVDLVLWSCFQHSSNWW